jgi:hypothetical protein
MYAAKLYVSNYVSTKLYRAYMRNLWLRGLKIVCKLPVHRSKQLLGMHYLLALVVPDGE